MSSSSVYTPRRVRRFTSRGTPGSTPLPQNGSQVSLPVGSEGGVAAWVVELKSFGGCVNSAPVALCLARVGAYLQEGPHGGHQTARCCRGVGVHGCRGQTGLPSLHSMITIVGNFWKGKITLHIIRISSSLRLIWAQPAMTLPYPRALLYRFGCTSIYYHYLPKSVQFV
jgi:hypothetical protein